MSEHYPRHTISASAWCGKCQKHTQHRIDDRRKGPCLACIARLETEHNVIDIDELRRKLRGPEQKELFAHGVV